MIDTNLDGVPRTLFLTLRARADEHQREDALFHDEWSADWNTHAPEYPDFDEWYADDFQLTTAVRTALIDEMVKQFIEDHESPMVVELGAGLSTRYYRLGKGKTRWIEMDLPTVIAVRRKLDVETDEHWFLPASLEDENWMDPLPEHDPEQTLFIAEGVAMFLTQESIRKVLDQLREAYGGARFIMDVAREAYREQLNNAFDSVDAQWGVQPEDLKALGLDVQETKYLLLEFSERWEALGVPTQTLKQDRSGFVVEATLKAP